MRAGQGLLAGLPKHHSPPDGIVVEQQPLRAAAGPAPRPPPESIAAAGFAELARATRRHVAEDGRVHDFVDETRQQRAPRLGRSGR